jgi:hypothetical protein
MESTKEFCNGKRIVAIDDSLDTYTDNPIFQKKLDMANEMLKNVTLPPEYWESRAKLSK